jgi:antitoxin ParD1/3/4
MASTINLSLTDELREFIDRNSGDGSDYSTASEFLRDVLRDKKQRQEIAALRDGVLRGYGDLVEGRFVEFTGSVKKALAEAKHRDQKGW